MWKKSLRSGGRRKAFARKEEDCYLRGPGVVAEGKRRVSDRLKVVLGVEGEENT